MVEKFFWADKIAEDIIKKNPKKKVYVCASGITPSGEVHIGNFREVITTDLVVKALEQKGKKARFIYSWDDFDRFRKIPANLPNKEKYEKYLGMPLSDIPSPEKGKSYAEFFVEQFEKGLKNVSVNPEFIQQSEMGKKSKYAELIKTALEKKDIIKKILDKYRKEPLASDWIPITVYCEKCMKDSTTVLSHKGYEIEYECECGAKDKIDFRKKGLVKLVWRVDWPARWVYEDVDFEPGGIDHSTPGGSYTTAKEIVKQVYSGKTPLYQFYEWVRIKGGTEFSSSKGNVTTLADVEEIYEPEVLRYLFVGTRPNKGFQISFDKDVMKIYEDFDTLEEKYYTNKLNPQEKRAYELSKLKIDKKKPERIGFRHLITLILVGENKNLKGNNKVRAEKVKNWIEKYAEDDMKFEIQTKINLKLNKEEKEILLKLKDILKKDLTEDKLMNEFYELCKESNIGFKDFFKLSYRTIINKEKGPRLASLILSAGKDKIIKLLGQIK